MVARQLDVRLVKAIRSQRRAFESHSDEQLQELSLELQFSLPPVSKSRILATRAFPIIMEAIRRETGKIAHEVQIFAAERMLSGHICEMKTGEGKTLTALLVLYALSLKQEGVHLATANDYLAARDSEYAGSIFRKLGLNVGVVTGSTEPQDRYGAYRKHITYGTAKEFGFDFLRDELGRRRGNERTVYAQKNILLDEADSLLIDEASTPLIIGMNDPAAEEQRKQLATWADQHAVEFNESEDFEFDGRQFSFLLPGAMRLRQLPTKTFTQNVSLKMLSEYLENAIKGQHHFQRDVHYRIVDNKIAILDEFTGRIAEGRQWQKGLHQAIEAKEEVEISPRTETAATVTMQTLVNRYGFVTGMTGTAWDSKREFKKVYQLPVIRIPTHRPIQRIQLPTQVHRTRDEKFDAIVGHAAALADRGRAVLIGTRTLEQSELLSVQFTAQRLPHFVLNASREEHESSIVADAGQPERITVATNMAGRGTDIPLHPDVRKQGGLHVILSELHESARIDWQLIGRGARQGDPGSFQIHVSLEDEILTNGLDEKQYLKLRRKWGIENFVDGEENSNGRPLPGNLFRWFRKAQRKIEKQQLKSRMILLNLENERQERFQETGENCFLYPPR